MLTNEEELKCDGDGYFDLDAIKPYSSVLVSPKNTLTRCQVPEKDADITMKVPSTKPCSDLHSLLDSVIRSSNEQINEDIDDKEPTNYSMPSLKSDEIQSEAPKANEVECIQLPKMSDKILELMSEQTSESESITEKESKDSNPIEKPTIEDSPQASSVEDLKIDTESSNEMLTEEPKQLSDPMIETSKSFIQHKCKEIHSCTTDSQASFTDNGKLQAELQLTELDVKDQTGRDYHLVIKYVWETNFEQFSNGALAVLDVSPSFVQLVNRLSPPKTEDKVESNSLKIDLSHETSNKQNKKCIVIDKKVLAPVNEVSERYSNAPSARTVSITPETKPRMKKLEPPLGKAGEPKTSFRQRVSSVASAHQERIENIERRTRLSNMKKAAGIDDSPHPSNRMTGFKRDERRPPTAPLDIANKLSGLPCNYNNRFTRKGFKGKFGQANSLSTNVEEIYKK